MREAKSHSKLFLVVVTASFALTAVIVCVVMYIFSNTALSSNSSSTTPDRELISAVSDPVKPQEEDNNESSADSSQESERTYGGSAHIWQVHGVILSISPTANSITIKINQADDSQLTGSQITYLLDKRTDVSEYFVGQNVVVEYVPPNDANGGKRAERIRTEE